MVWLRHWLRIFIGICTLATVASCGRNLSKRTTNTESTTPVALPNLPADSGCATPVSGSLTRLLPNADVLVGSPVQWQLTLSGGCATQYSLDGINPITNPYIFSKTYPQTGTIRESVLAFALFPNGTKNPLPQTISSDPFTVRAAAPVAPLSCTVLYPNPTSLSVDANGNITTNPLPLLTFGIQSSRNGTAASARIVSVQSLYGPANGYVLRPGFTVPTAESASPIDLPVIFAKAGLYILGINIASQNPDQTGLCTLVYNIVGIPPAPPVITSFTASQNPVVEGSNVILSWTTTGNVSGCRLYGSVRGYSAEVRPNDSLTVTLNLTESFRLDCREIQSPPLVVSTLARPASIALDFAANNTDPNDPSKMRGQPNPPLFFQNLGAPGGVNYGQFFYPGVETTSFVSGQLGIDPARCPQSKFTAEGVTQASVTDIGFSREYANGNPMAPQGNVGVFAFGHGGATAEVALQTNYRTLSLRSTFPRFGGVQSPFIFTNGFKVVIGVRTYENYNSSATVLTLAPGEIARSFSTSINVFDNAGLGGGLWKATCN